MSKIDEVGNKLRLNKLVGILKTGERAAAAVAKGVKLIASGICRTVKKMFMKFMEKTPLKVVRDGLKSALVQSARVNPAAVRGYPGGRQG